MTLRPLALVIRLGTAIAIYPLMWRGRVLQRSEGGLLLAGYVAYVAFALM